MSRAVELVDVHHLFARLTTLRERMKEQDRVSHAAGVQAAIDLIKRDLEATHRERSASASDAIER